MISARLRQQFEFIKEIDKMKSIYRQSFIIDGTKRENDAEHSWHLAMIALTLQEYAKRPISLVKVMKMVLLHDIVEIDAGDTFVYDENGNQDKRDREVKAADRLFGTILPTAQGTELRQLWDEFEAAETAESCFANAIDRIAPMLLNVESGGKTWLEHDMDLDRVLAKNKPVIEKGAPELWAYVEEFLTHAVEEGMLRSGKK